MARTRNNKPKGEPPEPAPDRHKNTVASFRPEAALRATIQGLADADRRSFAQMVEILLEEALATRGLWPAKEGE